MANIGRYATFLLGAGLTTSKMLLQVMTKPDKTPPASVDVEAIFQARRLALASEVQAVLTERGWSLQQAEIQTGIPASTIGRLKDGLNVKAQTILAFAEKAGGDMERWKRIAAGLPVRPRTAEAASEDDDVLLRVGPPVDMEPLRNIPHHSGYVSANPTATVQAMSNTDGFLGAHIPSYTRSIEVRGDCMLPFYQSGDILIVRETEEAKPGEKVIALVDSDTLTCKVFRMNGKPWLEPTNGEGKIEAGRFRIVGVVDALFRPERGSTRHSLSH